MASAMKLGSIGGSSAFVPNPVQSLGDESLTDQRDSDDAVPAGAYYPVTLTNLDGSGFLRGDYANVVSETGRRNTFTVLVSARGEGRSTISLREFASTSGDRTIPSPTTIQSSSCVSAKAAWTTRRTAG